MTTKHTPEPWKAQVYYTSHRIDAGEIDIDAKGEQANGSHVATVKYGPVNGWGLETATANARLIAAAPELLEALKAAVGRMEAVSERIPVENRAKGVSQALHVRHMAGHLAQHAKLARAAIAKATIQE